MHANPPCFRKLVLGANPVFQTHEVSKPDRAQRLETIGVSCERTFEMKALRAQEQAQNEQAQNAGACHFGGATQGACERLPKGMRQGC